MPSETAAATDESRRGELLARVAPLIFLLFWSSGFAVAKVGLRYAEPLTFLALRYAIIVVIFLPLWLILRPGDRLSRRDWGHLVAIGFLMQSVYFGLAYLGMNLGVPAGAAAVIASLQPLIVAVAAPYFADESPSWVRWIGLLLGAAGAVAVVVGDSSFESGLGAGSAFGIGLLCCLGSAFGMSAASIYQRRVPVTAHPVTVNLVHYAVGLASLAPLALIFETRQVNWTLELGLSLGWLVGANSLISIGLLLFMLRRSEASKVSALFFLIPPIAALYGWALLGETLLPLGWIGMAIAATGVAIVSRAR